MCCFSHSHSQNWISKMAYQKYFGIFSTKDARRDNNNLHISVYWEMQVLKPIMSWKCSFLLGIESETIFSELEVKLFDWNRKWNYLLEITIFGAKFETHLGVLIASVLLFKWHPHTLLPKTLPWTNFWLMVLFWWTFLLSPKYAFERNITAKKFFSAVQAVVA